MRAIAVVATAVVAAAAAHQPPLLQLLFWRSMAAALVLTAAHGGTVELQPVFMTNIKMTPPTALRRHFDS